ncbi:chromate transporter [bacterium]|nr:chromate transporter [bacterium]
MIYLNLFFEFFKIGLFSFGGGYATLPFLYHISNTHNWYSLDELARIAAIASITPGPIGINMATYAGLKTAGLFGSILSTIAIILPSFILIVLINKLLNKLIKSFFLDSIIETLKPIGCALLVAVAIKLLSNEIKNPTSLALLFILILISWKTKKSPLFCIVISAIFGILTLIF